jgi:hypothetical protein
MTSDWVLVELADHLCNERNRRLFGEVIDAIHADRRYEIVSTTPAILEQAIDLYRDRSDKDWSLTDCTSFIIMRERGLSDALTGDRHFEQSGFTALLK